jgi:hypothetical protein
MHPAQESPSKPKKGLRIDSRNPFDDESENQESNAAFIIQRLKGWQLLKAKRLRVRDLTVAT